QKDPLNATSTSTSQRSTNDAADTRKRPPDAGNAPANKKQATTSSNASTAPSIAPAKKKQAATGSGQKRMTRSSSAAAQKQKKIRKRPIYISVCYAPDCLMLNYYLLISVFLY
ncbi:hypothetical protein Tco_1367146, partial [Tanacetum coccineum]